MKLKKNTKVADTTPCECEGVERTGVQEWKQMNWCEAAVLEDILASIFCPGLCGLQL